MCLCVRVNTSMYARVAARCVRAKTRERLSFSVIHTLTHTHTNEVYMHTKKTCTRTKETNKTTKDDLALSTKTIAMWDMEQRASAKLRERKRKWRRDGQRERERER